MTDTPKERDMGLKVALQEHAWTPGPWLFRAKSGSWHAAPEPDAGYAYGAVLICTPEAGDMEFANDCDADLIALAPEMAEAIFRADFACPCEGGDQGFYCPEPVVHVMAEKLRAIGGSHE